jgi:hypothetical protein
MTPALPPNHVAKWSAPSAHHEDKAPPYDCGPHVSHEASMDQAVLAQNGRGLEARSGVCLLIAVYAAAPKMGALIHLWRNDDLWAEQEDLIRSVFTRFPQICNHPYVGFVSNKKVEAEQPGMAAQAKELVRTLAPTARIEDVWVHSPDHPDVDPELVDPAVAAMGCEMSVEVCLGTAKGQLLVDDDFGAMRTIDLTA